MAADVLVVDDEADIRDLVAGILTDEGYDVRTASDSESALAAVRARKPSLLILDIWMQGGGMDGLELLDLVKALDNDLPVIMISGHGNIETAVSSIKRGAYEFLEKPFKSDRLLLVNARLKLPAYGVRTDGCEPRRSHQRACWGVRWLPSSCVR
jgi:two-component system, NtrC family, nitrogen regulation response regulator NtrX